MSAAVAPLWLTHQAGEALAPAALLSQIKLPLSAAPHPLILSCAAGLLCGGLKRSGCLWRWFPLLSCHMTDTCKCIYKIHRYQHRHKLRHKRHVELVHNYSLFASCNMQRDAAVDSSLFSANRNRSTSHYTLYTLYTMWGYIKMCVPLAMQYAFSLSLQN